MLVFSLGAGVSIYEGILHLLHPEPAEDVLVAFVVLGVAVALEGWSTLAALKQFNAARGDKSIFRAIRDSKDAPNLVVLLENSGAIAGLLIAAVGLGLSTLTGSPTFRRCRFGPDRPGPRRDGGGPADRSQGPADR